MKKRILSIGTITLLVFLLFSARPVSEAEQGLHKIPIQPIKEPVTPKEIQEIAKKLKKPVPVNLEKILHAKPFTTISSGGAILAETFPGSFKSTSTMSSGEEVSPLTTGSMERITDPSVHPYKAVAYMEIEHPDGDWYSCTGYFIDDNTILTAAHCVFDTYQNKWMDVAYIYPGRNGDKYNQVFVSSDFRTNAEWVNANPPKPGHIYESDTYSDFAVIYVADNAAGSWFGLSPNGHSVDEQVNATGYPGSEYVDPDCTMWRSLGNITKLYDLYFQYDSNVKPGMSGGPVFRYSSGSYLANGINSNVDSAGNAYSPRITGPIYDLIVQWIHDSD